MRCYAVIDTNVLVSALTTKHNDAATLIVLTKVLAGEIIPLFSTDILDEYSEVLRRPKFGFQEPQIQAVLGGIERFGILIEPSPTGETLPDMDDLPFYEVVMEKRADGAYLVTGNQKHFPVKPFIVTARQLLDIMNGQNTPK